MSADRPGSTLELSPEERAAFLEWPARRNCDWDCPWPRYCVDCHTTAYNAMVNVRRRLLEVMMRGAPIRLRFGSFGAEIWELA